MKIINTPLWLVNNQLSKASKTNKVSLVCNMHHTNKIVLYEDLWIHNLICLLSFFLSLVFLYGYKFFRKGQICKP